MELYGVQAPMDTPYTTELMPVVCDRFTAQPSNNLLNWIPYLHLNDRRGGSV